MGSLVQLDGLLVNACSEWLLGQVLRCRDPHASRKQSS